MFKLTQYFSTAPMDYIAFAGRQLSFAANSNMGDIVCTSIEIVNDDVLEANLEEFFADITSTAADIAIGRDRATIRLIESNDGSKRVAIIENHSGIIISLLNLELECTCCVSEQRCTPLLMHFLTICHIQIIWGYITMVPDPSIILLQLILTELRAKTPV